MQSQRHWGTSTRVRVVLSFVILSLCSVGLTQQTPDYKAERDWQQTCKYAEAQTLTPIQPAGPLSGDQLIKCDETALYYGLGEEPDYAAAVQCGWFQRAHPQETVGNMFYGPGVLTMLYANGKGVSRNYDLAIRFACENHWAAEAEMSNRIGHLEYLREAGPQNTKFDLCDDITSGLSDGFCTRIQTRMADAVRSRKVNEILDRLPLSVKSAFPSLQVAESAFEAARTRGEVDLSGTSRGAFQLTEEAKLRDQFLINLQRFGRGDVPAASENDLSLLDQNLNDIYQRIRHSPASRWEFGTIKPEGIRDTERKWVLLVDAWTTFARIAYPSLSTTRIRAQLIRLRLHQLRSLYGN
jgi:hypothetical protein